VWAAFVSLMASVLWVCVYVPVMKATERSEGDSGHLLERAVIAWHAA
jgi:hypothetical protein